MIINGNYVTCGLFDDAVTAAEITQRRIRWEHGYSLTTLLQLQITKGRIRWEQNYEC